MPAWLMQPIVLLAALVCICSGSSISAAADARVDEVALRYYASLKQTARVEAEIRRLRRLHPDWDPPADLWTYRAGSSDEADLWTLFAADRLDELRREIAIRRVRDAGWAPSSDLERKLRRKELRVAIVASARSAAWADVVSRAGNWRADVPDADVELLWLIGEGFARTGNVAEASQVLEHVLRTSSAAGERMATVSRALALLPMREAERLLALGRLDADGVSEFDAMAIDITRARISAVLRDAPAGEVLPAELERYRGFASAAPDPAEIALLGWYALKRADPAQALDHFKAAIARGGDARVALGLALTLRKLGRLRDAEEVAYAWREPLAANLSLFIDIVVEELAQRATLDPKRLARFADVTLQTESGSGAEALGWYAYNACQIAAASEWFRRAIAWLPKETVALGYALSLQRLKRSRELTELVNRYYGLFPSVVGLIYPGELQTADDVCGPRSGRAAAVPEERTTEAVFRDRQSASVRPAAMSRQPSWLPVPMPDRIELAGRSRTAPDHVDFPAAVDPENPYRSGGRIADAPARAIAGGWRPADPAMPVLEARRVAGVTAMPYERTGRSLLPGWNGAQQATAMPSQMLRAPRGSLWERGIQQGLPGPRMGSASLTAPDLATSTAANRFHP